MAGLLNTNRARARATVMPGVNGGGGRAAAPQPMPVKAGGGASGGRAQVSKPLPVPKPGAGGGGSGRAQPGPNPTQPKPKAPKTPPAPTLPVPKPKNPPVPTLPVPVPKKPPIPPPEKPPESLKPTPTKPAPVDPVYDTTPADAPDLSDRIDELLSQDSSIMRRARTTGLQQANRRGLLNSSMAVQAAQGAMADRAIDIGSQEVGQEYDALQQALGRRFETSERGLDRDMQRQLAKWNLKSSDRNAAAQSIASAAAAYQAQYQSIMANQNLTAEQRQKQLKAALAMRDRQMSLVEQLYNIDLKW